MADLARVELEGNFGDAIDWLHLNGLTDGLPVIPPTESRVAAMVGGSGRPGDELVGAMPPHFAPLTVEKVAVVAVMAGCEPAVMPAVLAALEAMFAPQFMLGSVQMTTSPATPLLVFNGPARETLGIECGTGCFGPGARANATIGRAVRLAMSAVGGARPGDGDPAPLGWPAKFTACFGENEEASPWAPLHTERGLRAEQNAVTVFAVSGMWPISESNPDPHMVLHQLTHGMALTGSMAAPAAPDAMEPVVVLTPTMAALLARVVPSKKALRDHLWDHGRVPLAWLPPYKHQATLERLAALGIEEVERGVPRCERPDDIAVIVAGGDAGVQMCGMSTTVLSHSATRAFELG